MDAVLAMTSHVLTHQRVVGIRGERHVDRITTIHGAMRFHETRVADSVVGHLHQDPLLRVHEPGLFGLDSEELGVEALDVVQFAHGVAPVLV